jgi:hypothetical protein
MTKQYISLVVFLEKDTSEQEVEELIEAIALHQAVTAVGINQEENENHRSSTIGQENS